MRDPGSKTSPANRAILATLREICLDYPMTIEKVKWDYPAFLVREKIFVLVWLLQSGEVGLWLKAAKGVQETFLEADPERYFRPPLFGPKGWIGAWLTPERQPDWSVIEDLIDESYRLVAPKKLVLMLGEKAPTLPDEPRHP